jgi:predicted metalloprotease
LTVAPLCARAPVVVRHTKKKRSADKARRVPIRAEVYDGLVLALVERMRWTPGNRGNIEDARGRSAVGMGSLGIGGFLVLLVLSWVSGTNLFTLLGTDSGPSTQATGTSGQVQTTPAEERMVDMVDSVVEDAQAMWESKLGSRYQRTKVVLFRDAVQSACGTAESATGPFYCPADQKVYLDLGFFRELSERFGAPGDFAEAYVITHEFGHHVQNLLGLNERASGDRRSGANSASVALELQADCFAGVWGHEAAQAGRAQQGHVELDPGDVDEAMRAAASIGDDRLQRMATGRVMPDRFTHGSSAQRVAAFKRGMESGDPRVCDGSATSTR